MKKTPPVPELDLPGGRRWPDQGVRRQRLLEELRKAAVGRRVVGEGTSVEEGKNRLHRLARGRREPRQLGS